MISEKGISGNPSAVKTLDFAYLRELGIKNIQGLAGDIWTDYNLHDPGVTLLETLCYALTDLSYRTEQLREAFQSDLPIDAAFIDKYLFNYEELIPSLPVTRNDLEAFIENTHEAVVSAWVNVFPLMEEQEMIGGGYEVSVFLKDDPRYHDLNSDVLEVRLPKSNIRAQIILFDENNDRLQWNRIGQIGSCSLATHEADNFFQFEKHNGQVLLDLELKWMQDKQYVNIPVKARIAISGVEKPLSKKVSINRYKDSILQILGGADFANILNAGLEKEHFKREILSEIKKSLIPVRGLCEDFTVFRVVNVQEIKMDIQLALESEAPDNGSMIQKIYDTLDRFILGMVRKSKTPDKQDRKNILYTSNTIEELSKIKGVRSVQLQNLNLFVDGIPTISLQDESSFDCLNLQNFSHYVPKISREKSVITFLRNGLSETFRASEVSAPFTPRSLGNFMLESKPNPKKKARKSNLDDAFFNEINTYFSIQDDLPQNYGLASGEIPKLVSEEIKGQQRRFKSYLLFFERLLVDYVEKLSHMRTQLSMKPEEDGNPYLLNNVLASKLPDVKNLQLINDRGNTTANNVTKLWQQELEQKEGILDHMLARFGIQYKQLRVYSGAVISERVKSKIRLLKDIPEISRSRGLGMPLTVADPSKIWGAEILSGPQRRIYRLLGIGGKLLVNEKLSILNGGVATGFYMVEHRLLVQRDEQHVFDKKLNKASSLMVDYINDLDHENGKHLSYSFQVTIMIPDWHQIWSKNRQAYETVIKEEIPAHIIPKIYWVDKSSLEGFEILYEDWIKTLFSTS